jgi:hypothetical protein
VTQLRHTTRALFPGKVSFGTVFAGLMVLNAMLATATPALRAAALAKKP